MTGLRLRPWQMQKVASLSATKSERKRAKYDRAMDHIVERDAEVGHLMESTNLR